MPLHTFDHSMHHPIIQVAQHITSPLTASLSIFLIHKTWQWKVLPSLLRAHYLIPPKFTFQRHGLGGLIGLGGLSTALTWGSTALSLPARKDTLLSKLDTPSLFSPLDTHDAREHVYTAPSVVLAGDFLSAVRDRTGMTWGATICTVTLGLRCLLAPIQVGLLANALRLKMIWPEVQALGAQVRGAGGDTAAALSPSSKLLALLRAHKCSPLRQCFTFPLFLPATILSVFGAMHNLVLTEASMAVEGFLWFPDLVQTDPTRLLPILSALTWLLNVELGAGRSYEAWPEARIAARLGAVACIPLAETLPCGVLLFWVTSNVFALGRGALLRQDKVRKLLNIPLQKEIDALLHLPKPRPM